MPYGLYVVDDVNLKDKTDVWQKRKKKRIFKDIIGVWFLFQVIWRFLFQFTIHLLRNFCDILTCRLEPRENNFYTEHFLQEEKFKVCAKVKNSVLNKWVQFISIRLFVTHMDYSITRFRFAFMPPSPHIFFRLLYLEHRTPFCYLFSMMIYSENVSEKKCNYM